MTGWRSLLTPVDDKSLPGLSAQLARASQAVAMLSIGAGAAVGALAWISGETTGWRVWVLVVAYTVGFGGTSWLARTARGRAHPALVLHPLACCVLVASVYSASWLQMEAPAALYGPVTPVVVSCFVPWRPTHALAYGAASTLLSLLGAPAPFPVPVVHFLFIGAVYASLAALAAQVHRRLLAHLDIAQRRLVAADRLSGLGRMMAGLAHELKTPTAAASHGLERARALLAELAESIGHDGVTDDDLREIVRELGEATAVAQRGIERTARFVAAVRSQTVGMHAARSEPFAVSSRLPNIVTLLEHQARRAGLTLRVQCPSSVTVFGDPEKFDQVVTNLVLNAIEACAEARRGTEVRVEVAGDEDGCVLAVIDDGPGVSAAVRGQIFEPLSTTRSDTGGTGLGLSISRDIVDATFGGSLRLVPTDSGARFEAVLPRSGGQGFDAPAFVPGARGA